MRTFISLNPAPATKQKILEIQEKVRSGISEINAEFLKFIKWESEDKFHMTLFFIGDINANQCHVIDSCLLDVKKELSIKEINFSAAGISAFPKLRFPGVIIIELKDEDKRAFDLSEKINHCMKESGFFQDKSFRPHLTLGRVKRDKKLNLTELKDISIELNFSVESFYFMESKLKSSGSEYS
ncbi:MAG: RNA 2',3'-cyclic phosphodiesterase, partial [Bacteroidota bacterium]|nr:RNA 2',3'-cyclic phosphodiesterase [Bacteroidota bacterium]